MDKSYWISSVEGLRKNYDKLDGDENVDVCIIGGGLTGLTCGYYLSKLGKKVIIVEKDKIMNHTSGNTTAKITSQHGLFYDYLIKSQGKEKAKQYLEANEQAIKNIHEIIEEEKIDCDFEWQDAYVFTEDENEVDKIFNEVEAVNSLGFNAEFVENIEINKKILGAIKFKNQAGFNPCKYGLALADSIEKNDGKIFENSKVIDFKTNFENYEVITEEGKIIADKVIIASHYPIINFPGFYFFKMYQETSYLVAFEVDEELFNGMYISSGNTSVSFRTANYNNKKILIVGGSKHKTGEKIDLKNSYKYLENIAKSLYPSAKPIYYWNTEDTISLDKIPYIGEFSNLIPDVYVATGYKKWGMTTSNVAANIIVDKIMGKENSYEDVFKSTRLKPIKNYKELGNMIKQTSFSLIINKLNKSNNLIKDIEKGDGKIVEIDGIKVGVYKDEKGRFYAIKPNCSHLGCELSWNNLDKTWDCPCHGSRFNYEGKSIYEPSIKDLAIFYIEK